MIIYHGSPFGGPRMEAARFFAGRHALVPYPRPDDLQLIGEVSQSFVVDNGAFSVWRKGGQLDVEGYCRWVHGLRRNPGFDWALIPDVIDGDESQNDAMIDDWPRTVAGVPVYHLHEPVERARQLAIDWPIVAIGSSGQWPTPGAVGWHARMAEVMDAVCDDHGRPICHLHGLRMADPAIFTSYPFRSVDSTNCAQNGARNGAVIDVKLTAGQGAIITAWRIEAHQSPAVWDRSRAVLVREKQKLLAI